MDSKLAQLHELRAKVEQGGGQDRIDKQHAAGKMTARERINALLDDGSFVELDAFTTHRSHNFGMAEVEAPGEGVVVGYGTVQGRRICLASQDFTVIGGSLGEMHAQKICKAMDLSRKLGVPFISINDSGGARIQEGVDALKGYGDIFYRNTILSGVVPQISVILGPCAGGAVYSPALTDFVFMVSGLSNMFITGPQVIKAVTNEDVSVEELGGAMMHNQTSGVAHFAFEDEASCISSLRSLLSYLPANNLEDPPASASDDPIDRRLDQLQELVPADPNRSYNMYELLESVIDAGTFLEVHPWFATNMITGFARLGGKVVGLVANQPREKAGCLDIDASDKAARFVRFCDAFNVPLVTFVDVPGYLPGVEQEWGGIIRHGAKLLYAYSEATVPKLTVIVRKAYGGAYIAMCSRHLGADLVFALPTAEIAVMGPEGAANIIFRKQIGQAEDPQAKRQEKIEEFRERFANPYVAASRGYVDDVIEAAEVRVRLCSALDMVFSKQEMRPTKKHGNIPL